MFKKVAIEVIVGVMLLALLVVGIVGYQYYKSPLAEPMSIVQAAPGSGLGQTSPTATSEPAAAASQKLCGLTGEMSLLIIGRDETFWEPPYGADAIRMVKINFDQKVVKVFAFERDLLLSTPQLDKPYGAKTYELGEAYTLVRGKEGKNTPGADIKAANALAQILYDNFEIIPDHYLTIEESVLPDVVDTLGGVTVNASAPIFTSELKVVSGEQMMDGKTAMLYSRYLTGGMASEDEWGRMERQSAVVKGIATKLLDPKAIITIPDLFKKMNKSVVTDLSLEQIKNLACVVKEISVEDVTMKTIEKDQLDIQADETMMIKNMDEVKAMIKEFFAD